MITKAANHHKPRKPNNPKPAGEPLVVTFGVYADSIHLSRSRELDRISSARWAIPILYSPHCKQHIEEAGPQEVGSGLYSKTRIVMLAPKCMPRVVLWEHSLQQQRPGVSNRGPSSSIGNLRLKSLTMWLFELRMMFTERSESTWVTSGLRITVQEVMKHTHLPANCISFP